MTVPGLSELAARHTELTGPDLDRLGLLLADWQLIADLAFSDLVLWLPTWNTSGYVAAAHVRPTTGPTVFADDLVGTFLPRGRRPVVDEALAQGRVITVARCQCRSGRGAGSRCRRPAGSWRWSPSTPTRRSTGRAARSRRRTSRSPTGWPGWWPRGRSRRRGRRTPRRTRRASGTGCCCSTATGGVTYASPNALSAYRRLGLAADLVGTSLAQTSRFLSPRRGPVDEDPTAILSGRTAGSVEIEAKGAVVALRTLPLLADGRRTGTLVLLRDVSDLRRRERELVTKDATIREIHHRVKNNLQTVAALLRLQARRLDAPDAIAALAEAERRVGSIALVHEMLSTSPDPDVPFDEIADRLLGMLTEFMAPEADERARARGASSYAGSGRSASWTPSSRPRWRWCSTSWRRTPSSTGWPAAAGPSRSGPSGSRASWSWRSRTTGWGCRPTSTARPQPGWACRSPARWWPTSGVRWSSGRARAAAPGPSYGFRCAERLIADGQASGQG